MSSKVLAGSAGKHSPAEVASDADCELQNRRNHNDAFGLVEQVLRNPVGDVHNFLEHLTARFQPLLLPALIRAEDRTRHKNGYDKGTRFSHRDRKSTRLNSSHTVISYAVFCLKNKKNENI